VLIETEGIVLKKRKLNHSDVFLTLFSKNLGKIQVFAKGASNPRSSMNKGAHPFVHGRYALRGDKTYTLSSVEIISNFYHFRENLKKLSYASYFLDLVEQSIKEDEVNHQLFQGLIEALMYLDKTQGYEEKIKLHFELNTLRYLGIMPEVTQCIHCGKKDEHFRYISMAHGGVVCTTCLEKGNEAAKIHPTLVELMAFTTRIRMGEFLKKDINGLLIEKMDIFINSFIDYHLGVSRIKSRKFLKIYE
jgi:DNA repair protein RecO (recombination protein O)